MLPLLSRKLRLALMLTLSAGYIGYHGHTHAAFAKGDDDSDSDSDDPDEKGSEDKGDEEGDEGPDLDQPPVTAGGLFTMKTYPQNEILRPLIMTEGITQLRLSLGTDLSAKGAFGSIGVSLEGVHGVTDNFMVVGGFTSQYNAKAFSVYAGFEASLYYDVVDFRAALNYHHFALPLYCGTDPNPAATCDLNSLALPDGNYNNTHAQLSLDLGFPFRYSFAPQVAVVALQTLMSIDFWGYDRGDITKRRDKDNTPVYCTGVNANVLDANNNPLTADLMNCRENGAKPDFNPSIGVAFNPIAALSVVVQAQLRIPDFDTSAGNFQVPVTGRVEFSPNQQFDVGLEFTLVNVKPPDPQSPIDNRFLSLFAQARF